MSVNAVALLARLANGESVPPELALQHHATSAHITTVTTARADGSIEIATTTGNHPVVRLVRGGDLEKLRAAARLLVEAGFPRIERPKGPPPPPTVPPVRVVVRTTPMDSIAAEVSAAQLDAVPAFDRAVHAIAELGTPAARAAEEAKAALETFAGVAVEVRFVPDAQRSFALRLAGGVLTQVERDGDRERKSGLGPTTADERTMIAHALRDAGFPRRHGWHRRVEGPHHVLTVEHRDVAVAVVMDAEAIMDPSPGAAIRALYRAAVRFGVRPLELRDTSARS